MKLNNVLQLLNNFYDSLGERVIEVIIDYFDQNHIENIDIEKFKKNTKDKDVLKYLNILQNQYTITLTDFETMSDYPGVLKKIYINGEFKNSIKIIVEDLRTLKEEDLYTAYYEIAIECLTFMAAFEEVFEIDYKNYKLKLKKL